MNPAAMPSAFDRLALCLCCCTFAMLLPCTAAATAAFAEDDIVLVQNYPALKANDSTNWQQLGADQTVIP
jgi:hypothetical protein